jgi:uncharacterized protein YbjT (DUF2867 family)
MKIIVFGGAGLLGRAIGAELRSHGHQVVTAGRSGSDVRVNFCYDHDVALYRALVKGADIVVNAVGILIERGEDTFEAIHVQAPTALFKACEAERVARIVHISGLGVGTGIRGAYMRSKLAAEHALEKLSTDYAIVRPALLVDAQCPSTQLFRFLARMPLIALPGLLRPGASLVAPILVTDVAQAVTRICEHPKALRRVIELCGPQVLRYRDMLASLRAAQTKLPALWLPMPWWLMKLSAWAAKLVPQKVFSIDTLRMLKAGSVSENNEAMYWLRRMPKQALAHVFTSSEAPHLIAKEL